MPVVSGNALRFAHVRETTAGVTPATPVFNPWRLNTESLSFEPNALASEELSSSGRSAKPGDVVGSTVSGDINLFLTRFDALDEAIQGILANPWGEGPLTPGSTGGAIDNVNRNTIGNRSESFTIEKRWPDLRSTAGAMPITATADAAPGASLDITLGAGTAVGSGVVVVDFQTDADLKSIQVVAPIAVGDDQDDVASTLATLLDAQDNLSASAVANVVTLTADGDATTISALASRAGRDQYVFQRFTGCTYSALTLNVTPNQRVTAVVGIVAGVPYFDYLPIAGATYTDPGEGAKFTAPQVLELTVGSLPGIATSCWSSLTITLNSQNREIACIGSLGSRESALGTFIAQLSGDLYFVGDVSALQSMLNDETVGNSVVTLSNADGDIYRFDLYGMKVTGGNLTSPGQDSDVSIPLVLDPTPVTVQTDSGDIWNSSLVLSRVSTAPTLP